jgi:hypothetical protein
MGIVALIGVPLFAKWRLSDSVAMTLPPVEGVAAADEKP